jgi:hypothetical protein
MSILVVPAKLYSPRQSLGATQKEMSLNQARGLVNTVNITPGIDPYAQRFGVYNGPFGYPVLSLNDLPAAPAGYAWVTILNDPKTESMWTLRKGAAAAPAPAPTPIPVPSVLPRDVTPVYTPQVQVPVPTMTAQEKIEWMARYGTAPEDTPLPIGVKDAEIVAAYGGGKVAPAPSANGGTPGWLVPAAIAVGGLGAIVAGLAVAGAFSGRK